MRIKVRIKVFLTIYSWLLAMGLIMVSDDPIVRGFTSAWCFFAGMFCTLYMEELISEDNNE